MSYPQRIEEMEERAEVTGQGEDPRCQYEWVDGIRYAYAGLAGDPNVPPPCEEVDGVLYPYEKRGAPVVRGDIHEKTVNRLEKMTTGLLLAWRKVGIFSDVYLYWKKGQKDHPAPDLYVFPRARQFKRRRRQSVFLWREPSHPVFVLEVMSSTNTPEVMEERFQDYQNGIKIPEYFQCDPRPEPPQVWGLRLENGVYVPIPPDERGRIWSEQLEGWFGVNENGQVQVWDEADEPMPDYKEALQERKQAIQERQEAVRERDAAQARARALEARVHELERQLESLRSGSRRNTGE